MGKKILQRSFALGAMMAVVITGNVCADNKVIDNRADANNTTIVTNPYNNIDFKNITNTSNGGVFNFGSSPVEFTNCNFLNNKVEGDNKSLHGGAIYSTSSALTITGGSFVGNSAVTTGGNTKDTKGGAIAQSGGSLKISGTVFKENFVSAEAGNKYGAAIHGSDTTITITNCTFTSNGGYNGNSVIFVQGGKSTVNLEGGNRFENNIANSVNAQNSGDKIVFRGKNEFIGNKNTSIISHGTVLFNNGSETIIDDSGSDYSIWNRTTGIVYVEENSFVDCEGAIRSDGNFNLSGKLNVGGTSEANSDFTKTNITDSGVLNANGYINFIETTIDGTLNVTKTGKANFIGATTVDGTLNISGDTTINKISGNGTVNFLEAVDVSVADNQSDLLKLYVPHTVVKAVDGDVNNLIKKIDHCKDTFITITKGGIATATAKIIDYADSKVATTSDKEQDRFGFMYVDYTDSDNFKETLNPENQAVGDKGIALKLHWRSHLSDMNKRMGELRDAQGELGVWTRMVRGENEYKGTKAQYNQYQLGYDERLSVDKRWIVGTAVTFADGDASYGYGSTEDKSTAFTVYGTKLNNDGSYVDLIARYEHMESDLQDALSGSGDYCANGMSVGAEFGKRFDQNDGAWIEPQVQLTYGTVDSAEFRLGDKTVRVGDMDSLIGRVGFRIGQDIEQGNIYARASYLYDFDGKTDATFSDASYSKTVKEDLGGGWWEVGVGTNINLSKATYLYAEVDKTFGGEVDTNWQWNLGVRYSF